MKNHLCQCGCGLQAKFQTRSNKKLGIAKGDPCRFRRGHYSKTTDFRRVMRNVDVAKTVKFGTENGNWKGGKSIDGAGYITVRVNGKQFREHRIVIEKLVERKLSPLEVVHHKNGNRADNRPENLEVISSQSEHMKLHMTSSEARRRGRLGGWSKHAALSALQSGEVIKAMVGDVCREATEEILDSKDARRAIGHKAALLYKKKVTTLSPTPHTEREE